MLVLPPGSGRPTGLPVSFSPIVNSTTLRAAVVKPWFLLERLGRYDGGAPVDHIEILFKEYDTLRTEVTAESTTATSL